MPGGGGGTTTTTTTQRAQPFNPAVPSLKTAIARNLSSYNADRTGRDSFATENPLQKSADVLAIDRARSGGGVQATMAGQEFTTGLLNDPSAFYQPAADIAGDIGNASPYAGADSVFDSIASQVTPRVQAMFGGTGRTGSGAHADTMTRAMTEAFAPTAMSLYENDQGRRLQSAGLLGSLGDMTAQRGIQAAAVAPGVDAATYADINRLEAEGTEQRAETQFNMDRDQMALDRFTNRALQLGGMGGTTFSQGTQPTQGAGAAQTATGGLLTLLPFLL